MLILWIILFSILGVVGAVMISATFLLFREKIQEVLVPGLLSYATGTLLASALLGLVPHALEYAPSLHIFSGVLAGIIIFFCLEKLIIWRHCHDRECEIHGTAGPMLLVGDAFHNFVDGVVIAASFLCSIPLGISASLSIIAHEIPQEVGDFAILLHSGYSKRKALFLNIVSGLTPLAGAILGYLTLEAVQESIPYIMAISAASFLYIALVDLSPELHQKTGLKHIASQLLLMVAGILTIAIILKFHP